MKLPSTKHWLFKAIALAVVVPIPVAVLAFLAAYVSGMEERGGTAESLAFLVFLAVPPLWLIALVFLGSAEMDMGIGEEPKGELENLLQKKHLGVLQNQPRQVKSWPEHPVKAPASNSAPAESGPVLDQLLAWQRQHRRKRSR
jgi:hypothetical protein